MGVRVCDLKPWDGRRRRKGEGGESECITDREGRKRKGGKVYSRERKVGSGSGRWAVDVK